MNQKVKLLMQFVMQRNLIIPLVSFILFVTKMGTWATRMGLGPSNLTKCTEKQNNEDSTCI